MKDNLVDMGAMAEEDSVDFVVNDSHSPYLPSRLFFHFLIITKALSQLCAFDVKKSYVFTLTLPLLRQRLKNAQLAISTLKSVDT